MSDETPDTPETPQVPPPKKRRVGRLLLVALLLLAGGGGAGYWFFLRPAPPAKGKTVKAAKPEVPPGIVALDPFLVNLADPGGGRFFRVSLRLLVGDEAEARELDENQVARAELRSGFLELLTQQTAEQLITPEGKAALKKALADRATALVKHLEVRDVLFTEFVVQ